MQRTLFRHDNHEVGGATLWQVLLRALLVALLFFSLFATPLLTAVAATDTISLGWWPRITLQLEKVWSIALDTSKKIFTGEALQVAQLGRSSNELLTIEDVPVVLGGVNSAYVPTATSEQGTLLINAPLFVDTHLQVTGLTTLSTTTILGLLAIASLDTESLLVRGAATAASFRSFGNVTIDGSLAVSGGIKTGGADIDLFGGSIFASNIVNEIVAGDNITITGTQNEPIISVDLDDLETVTSVNGEDGDVEFEEGDDIEIDGLTIENVSTLDSVRDRGGCSSCILDNDVIDQLTVVGGTINDTIIGASTPAAAYFTTVAIGSTSTPSTLNVFGTFTTIGTATSTFGGGINISEGCYAVDGVCIAGAAPASYVGLTDTPSSLITGAIQFANASGTVLTQSSDLVFLNDRLGIGTSSPSTILSVVGTSTFVGTVNVSGGCVAVDGTCLGGATELDGLDDVALASSTVGDYLQYDGSLWRNTPIATLGLGDGTYLGLGDTPNSFVAGAIQFANATSSGLTQSATLVFSGGNLLIGTSSVATKLSVDGDISLVDNAAVRFYNAGSSNYVAFQASSSLGANTVWTLPTEDGTSNQILITDGNGNLSFVDVSAIGGGVSNYLDLTDTPNSFTAGAIQYVHASGTYLTQNSSFVFTGTNLGIGVAVPTDMLEVNGSVNFNGSGGNAGFYFDQSTVRVGIGTESPSSRLTVLGGSILQQGGNSTSEYSPVEISGLVLADTIFDLKVVGSYAYLVSSAAGNDFHVIDISNPAVLSQVTSINMSGTAQTIAVRGQYAFVGTDTAGNNFHVIDISDPTSPAIMTGIVLPGSVNDIVIEGRYAYVVTNSAGDDLTVVDISDPLNPVALGGIDLPTNTEGVAVQGEYAYVAVAGVGDEFYIINISDPTTPTSVASLPLSDAAHAVAVEGGYAYVATNSIGDDLHVIDIANPASPVEVDSVALDAAGRGVVVTGNYVYVATLSTGDDLEVVDVSNPSAVVKVGGSNLGAGDAYGIEIIGRYAYMTTSSGGNDFHIYDITGASLQSAIVYSIAGSNLTISNDANVIGQLRADGGIFAGLGGLVTDGSLISYGADDSYIGGALGLGTTSTSSKLAVDGSILSTSLLGGAVGLTTDANGVIIRDPSDERLKEHIVPLENALETLLELRGVRYEWRDKQRFGEQIEIGFIAQEVDLVLPEVVRKGGDYWALNTRNIIAVVVEGVKEMWLVVQGHSKEIEALETRVAELEAALDMPQQPVSNVSDVPSEDVEVSEDENNVTIATTSVEVDTEAGQLLPPAEETAGAQGSVTEVDSEAGAMSPEDTGAPVTTQTESTL